MSRPVPDHSPDERPSRKPLSRRVATATMRLILISIVAGGFVTVALNLRGLGSLDADNEPLTDSDLFAPFDDLLRRRFPLEQQVVRGDESAARDAVVHAGRAKIGEAASRVLAAPGRDGPLTDRVDPFPDAVELARDPAGAWSIRQTDDLQRRIVGISLAGGDPTILFWGGYDETGPGEWTTWTMLLPLTVK